MSENNVVDLYVDYINKKILPFIDYKELHDSYSSDMSYAKGVLNELHLAMVKIYSGRKLDEDIGDDGFIVIPGVVRGIKSGNMAIALLDLDLSSSGEHWGTSFLCKHGVVSQSGDRNDPAVKDICSSIGSYEYCYTAEIPCDIHINETKLPKEIKNVLKDYHKYKLQLSPSSKKLEIKSEKPSLINGIRDAEKDIEIQNKNKSNKKKPKPEL